MSLFAIPPELARNAAEAWGAAGVRWLAELPKLVGEAARRWDLALGPPYELSFNWVAPVTQPDGTPAVLKLGPVEPGDLAREAAALTAFDGQGAVSLLAHDSERGALLLERAEPGQLARCLVPDRDEQATAAAIAVANRLHRPPAEDCPLPELAEEAVSFAEHLRTHRGDDPLPRRLVEQAAELFDFLCDSAPSRVLLHGDLHHDNLLSSTREDWLAIDPHGAIGDAGYDVGAFLYNPDPDRHDDALLALVPRRIEQLADGLDLPVDRVVGWGFVQAVLSEVWSAQGGIAPLGRTYDVAMLLLPRLP